MSYVLILLLAWAGGVGSAISVTPVVAEFNTLEACWDAARLVTRPLDDQGIKWTSTACVVKGQDAFGQ